MTSNGGFGGGATDVERVFREVYGQAVATLVRVFGDITLAEDAVQHAFLVASTRWPIEGLPPKPAGWIVTTARNRAIDDLRRAARGRAIHQQIGALRDEARSADVPGEDGPVSNDQLRLIFTCCHPALRLEHQVALTLRLLGGLSVEEVARSFLVSESAVAKRLVRAKHKIKAAKIPYRVPTESDLPDRLRSVLMVIYLIYNSGIDKAGAGSLRADAIRLARALVGLMPDEPEAAGLLALMLLTESRMDARTVQGELVLLRDQDRARWDHSLIEEGLDIVRRCLRRNQPGPYQLQAAINAVHADAATFEETDWSQILALYDQLLAISPTPVVALNRAIAVGEVRDPEEALTIVESLGLDNYYAFHAARANLLTRMGRHSEAEGAYRRAAALAPTAAEQGFLLTAPLATVDEAAP